MVDYKIDWETTDGMVVMKNPKTIQRYKELKEEYSKLNTESFGVFWAFDQERFDETLNRLIKKGIIGESEKIYRGPAGSYGTKKGFETWNKCIKENNSKIKAECDPQEVYFYEYNNHESCISYEGDLEAIQLVAKIWGKDVAQTIKRIRAFYTIDEIMSGKPLN